MSKVKLMLLLFALSLTLAGAAWAQTPLSTPTSSVAATPDVQLLRAILEEQRLTRIMLQRTYVNAYRAQSLTERLARQQARVDSLGEEIAQLKSVIQHTQDGRDEDELKDLLATINETVDLQQRAALIQSYNGMKRAYERQREYGRQEAERGRERQLQLEATLRLEQGKLAEMQEQLDAIDREFEKQLSEPRKTR